MAKEYIDREALKRDLIDNRGFYPSIVKAAIENAPAADVVEVVRCRDCKFRLDRVCDCDQWANDDFATYIDENDFCSYGAKMDGKDEKI
jgi:hypothetical protein